MSRERLSDATSYDVRSFDPADRRGFLALYERVWGRTKSPAWFDWRFAENPFQDRVRMVVAEGPDGIVGVEPLVAYPLRVAGRTVRAFQPVDWMVHPGHQRRGLFTRMTEHLLESVRSDAAVLFNFPNRQLLPGLEKFDWRVADTVPTSYRIQRPRELIRREFSTLPPPAPRLGGLLATGVLKPYMRLIGGRRGPDSSDGRTVDRHEGIAPAPLRSVYDAAPPTGVHVPREERFLAWRFANPRWAVDTYVARHDGTPLAAAVVAVETYDSLRVASVLDLQPMDPDPDAAAAVERLLRAIVTDHADADLIKAASEPYDSVLRRCGFLRDDRPPVSRLASPSTLAVRPLDPADGDDLDFFGTPWKLALADIDIA